ncbi:hypothetical protein [Reinekea sp. G2M2-21]|uniref:hypothetical protein n=1 Tax=Reinekea sp. G2M2-21 TaxID=2788942 RepID=UPI0018AA3905|nr:hypothetical protein [Reinekea sp. G2M2-21]
MFKKIYYRILRDYTAVKVLAALVSSPQRYEYVAKKVELCELSNEQATEKNINKSIRMANQFVDDLMKNHK